MIFESMLPQLKSLHKAACILSTAKKVLINTGAGMSAESNIPTYRDEKGRWRDFEAFTRKGIIPKDIAHPIGYRNQFKHATAFHEYMRRLMWDAQPHDGYHVLTRWMKSGFTRKNGVVPSFVLTTNIDNLHKKAGVEHAQIYERYGNLWEFQCLNPQVDSLCAQHAWHINQREVCKLDQDTLTTSHHPTCLFCDGPTRPRIQMSHDEDYIADEVGWRRYQMFMQDVDVCIVIGTCLWLSWPEGVHQPKVIHINLDENTHKNYHDPIAITLGAQQALTGIDWFLKQLD